MKCILPFTNSLLKKPKKILLAFCFMALISFGTNTAKANAYTEGKETQNFSIDIVSTPEKDILYDVKQIFRFSDKFTEKEKTEMEKGLSSLFRQYPNIRADFKKFYENGGDFIPITKDYLKETKYIPSSGEKNYYDGFINIATEKSYSWVKKGGSFLEIKDWKVSSLEDEAPHEAMHALITDIRKTKEFVDETEDMAIIKIINSLREKGGREQRDNHIATTKTKYLSDKVVSELILSSIMPVFLKSSIEIAKDKMAVIINSDVKGDLTSKTIKDLQRFINNIRESINPPR